MMVNLKTEAGCGSLLRRFLLFIALISLAGIAAEAEVMRAASEEAMGASGLRRPNTAERFGWQPGDTVVTIPSTVRQIPAYTFAGLSELRRVEWAEPINCVKICEYAFAECDNLKEIELPAGLLTIEAGAFRECHSLRELHVPEGVWQLPSELCLRCENLATVELPDMLREIGSLSFAGCKSLSSLNFPSNLRRIGNNAFSGCSSLEEAELSDKIKELESYAFSDCTSLRRVKMPSNWNRLGELLFSGCSALEEIIEPSPLAPSFECESYPFDPEDEEAYSRCRLLVPAKAEKSYRIHHGWNKFEHIEPIEGVEPKDTRRPSEGEPAEG